METVNDKPTLSRTLFWDVSFDQIDWLNRAQSVIERVLERGSFAKWQEIKRYYGLEAMRQAALDPRGFDSTGVRAKRSCHEACCRDELGS